jgi:23S rRNA (guanine2445-N2)-methyltransferase / 23S rRNA (guanine2069-N7)-methyltransferase
MSTELDFFATTAKGMEAVLAQELSDLGARGVEERLAGAAFSGPLELGYRACLWSRIASRILLPLASFSATDPDALYEGVRGIDWREHIGRDTTLAVDCSISRSLITHSHYAALKTKDAVVDQLRDRTGSRPSIDVRRPGVRINLRIHDDSATVSLDLSGDALHRRGYRTSRTVAPLKENLAAAVLRLAEWPRLARQRAPLIDPMCGSGTILIEATQVAADIAPGAGRDYFGFLGWGGHDQGIWNELRREAAERRIRDPKKLPDIRGYDVAAAAVRASLSNVERADLRGLLHIEKRSLADCEPVAATTPGIVVTNPPYGERVGELDQLGPLYATLGDILRRRFTGWTGYVLTGNRELGGRVGLRTKRKHILYNGAIECRLLVFPISDSPVKEKRGPHWRSTTSPTANREAAGAPVAPRAREHRRRRS